jgi:putative ABC transport system permease protein
MDLWQDVRYAARRLVEDRWFTLAAVAALSLGIGANTTVFTFVNAVLLRGLPFEQPHRIVAVFTENERGQQMGVSLQDYLDLRDESRALQSMAGSLGSSVNLSDDELLPERVSGAYVTGNFFRAIGEQPFLGRGLSDDDDLPGADPVVLLGHSVWQNRYESDPAVLGRTVRVNSLVATVVGVMGENMRFPNNNDIWIPQVNLPPETGTGNRGTRNFSVIARLAQGVTIEQARDELRAIGGRLAEAYPETNANLVPGLQLYSERVNGAQIRLIFLSLMGAVGFVLLIACANVANLLLAKSSERAKEIAVRVSMGATRGRIVRQLLVESLLVAVLAALVGLGFAVLGVRWFDSVTQDVGKPYWMEFTLDPAVFGYMVAVCVGTAVVFGLAPALYVSRTDVNAVLKEGTRGGTGGMRARRWSGALIMGEVVLTLVLLSGAGFMMRSFLNLYTMDLGVDPAGLVTMEIYLPLTKYPEPDHQMALYDDLLDRMRTVPEIGGRAALTSAMPLSGGGGGGLEVDGREAEPGEERPVVTALSVSEDYFDVLRLSLRQGRAFNRDDGGPGSEVAIVNERFVELHLPNGGALGRQLRLVSGEAAPPDQPWLTVVGVVPNVRQRNVEDQQDDAVVYRPLRNAPTRSIGLLVRAEGDPAAATPVVRETMRAVEPDVPLSDISTLEERVALQRWPFRVFGTLFAVFAGIALTLSAVGIYSITANSVAQRTREFGIRASLGAEPRTISWLALRRILRYLLIAVPLGAAGAYGVGRLLRSLLVQTTPADPLTLGGVVLLMVGVAVLASLWPARRAARIDPMVALRVE